MDDDWDLHAIVKGCAASTSTTTSAAADPHLPSSFIPDVDCSRSASWLQTPLEPIELIDLQRPFLSNWIEPPQKIISPEQNSPFFQQFTKQFPQPPVQRRPASVIKPRSSHGSTRKSRKRKSLVKNVCLVDAENLSNDVWSWRKYGQKPIKGSPFPRGYYRCSSSKLCMARKQVERDKSNPEMFVVTYTAEHNHPAPSHRNSLAGTTRPKPISEEEEKTSEIIASVESTEKDAFSISDMALDDDDFFVGIEAFTYDDSDNISPGGGG